MAGFTKANIVIATTPPTEVQAMVRGGLAVHGSAGLYTVTHIASGKAICHSDQQRTAKGVVVELLDRFDQWQRGEDELRWVEPELAGWLAEMIITKPAPKPKSIVAPLLELEPIYLDYFTPSERLRELGETVAREVVAGKFGRIADASAAEWRETIMVRMGTGKQAKLLDKDIPDKSPPLFPLPPGILPGYAGVKQLTQRMWRLGQEIGIQAGTMIRYYNNGGDFGQNEFRWWLEQDDEFSALVQSGWCDWAVCVNLFTQLTKEEQQKITDVLGFVGSEEQGWHAYGAKTFMRSKRLPELIRCRRAVREALND